MWRNWAIYISLVVSVSVSASVRVLLDEWTVDAECAQEPEVLDIRPIGTSWSISVPQRSFTPLYTYDSTACNLVIAGATLRINGKRVAVSALYFKSDGNGWIYKGHTYPGDLMLVYHEDRWMLVNRVDLETYVWGVIRWESWPGWPLEINKVCAILARTYAVNRILHEQDRVRKGKISWYDVRATNAHQTYRGAHEHQHIRQAVDDTSHLVLTHEGKPIIAMYDACCGGVVPAAITGFDFRDRPYLARAYPCTFCRDAKAFAWDISYDKNLFGNLLRTQIPELVNIVAITDALYDAGGKLLSIIVHDTTKGHIVTGEQLYRACKDIKSFCYTIEVRRSTIRVRGTGLGHHMGLCQWGARKMVKQGHQARSIMDYYYPGTTLMRLTVKEGRALV
jgi:stage II sporulation protein D